MTLLGSIFLIFGYLTLLYLIFIAGRSIGFDIGSRDEYSRNMNLIGSLTDELNTIRRRLYSNNVVIVKEVEGYKPKEIELSNDILRLLKVGDRIELTDTAYKELIRHAKIKTRTGKVIKTGCYRIRILRDGKKTPESYKLEDLKLLDAVKANVYADFLEECGCPIEWTDKLRREFPM